MVIVSLVTYYRWECFNAPVFCRNCWFREYGGLFSSEGTGIIMETSSGVHCSKFPRVGSSTMEGGDYHRDLFVSFELNFER